MRSIQKLNSFPAAVKTIQRHLAETHGLKPTRTDLLQPAPAARDYAIAGSIRELGYRMLGNPNIDQVEALLVFVAGHYLRSAGPVRPLGIASEWLAHDPAYTPPSFKDYAWHAVLALSRGDNCQVPTELADRVRIELGIPATMVCRVGDTYWGGAIWASRRWAA